MLGQVAALVGLELGQIKRVVLPVELRSVALGRLAGLLEQVDADDLTDPELGELLADETVARTEVERGQPCRIDAGLVELLAQQAADDARRVAVKRSENSCS